MPPRTPRADLAQLEQQLRQLAERVTRLETAIAQLADDVRRVFEEQPFGQG